MEESFGARLLKAWNVFRNRDPTAEYREIGASYYYRPDRPRLTRGSERSIVSSVFNRIATDCAAISIRQVKLDGNGRYMSDAEEAGLNHCLNVEANLDQTGRAFIEDIVISMLDEGCVAIVPVDVNTELTETGIVDDILSMRTGRITNWYPQHVTVNLYNEKTGLKEDILLPKRKVAIVENPLFSVMNEPNSTMQRLLRKLAILDVVDEQTGSNKLNIIIQLPYQTKSEMRQRQAENRRSELEKQLAESKYGVAYSDGTEKIIQLNKPLENNLLSQIEYFTDLLHNQLGITKGILDGTASESEMLNYYNRTVEPILSAIADELYRKFVYKQYPDQDIRYFRDPFKLVPVAQIAEIADKMTRNEIMTSNEIRQSIGMKPSDDPEADKLRNKNLNQSAAQLGAGQRGMAEDPAYAQETVQPADPSYPTETGQPTGIEYVPEVT